MCGVTFYAYIYIYTYTFIFSGFLCFTQRFYSPCTTRLTTCFCKKFFFFNVLVVSRVHSNYLLSSCDFQWRSTGDTPARNLCSICVDKAANQAIFRKHALHTHPSFSPSPDFLSVPMGSVLLLLLLVGRELTKKRSRILPVRRPAWASIDGIFGQHVGHDLSPTSTGTICPADGKGSNGG